MDYASLRVLRLIYEAWQQRANNSSGMCSATTRGPCASLKTMTDRPPSARMSAETYTLTLFDDLYATDASSVEHVTNPWAATKDWLKHGQAARRLAEAECSALQIAAVTRRKRLAEVQRYTAAADQERLARGAMQRIR